MPASSHSTPRVTASVFISYSRTDRAFALELRQKLADLGFTLWRDIEDMPIGEKWWAAIQEAIQSCETLVLCMSPEALASPNVADEWHYAREIGKRVMPVVAADVDFSAVPRWMSRVDWADFRFSAKDADLVWQRFVNQLNTPYVLQKVPQMALPLDPAYVNRPAEFEPLVNALIGAAHREVAISAALRGAGGFGKTTLARAICHDRRVRAAFDDGILWVELGEKVSEPTLVDKLLDLVFKLTGQRPPVTGVQAASDELRTAIGDRYVLLVVDDAWESQHLQPFLVNGPHSAVLVTTRNSGILPDGMFKQDVDAMQVHEAVDLLRYGLPDGDDGALETLARRLGKWPMLLKLANGALRKRIERGETLDAALEWVNKALNSKGFDALKDPNNLNQRHGAVSATLGVSLELLSENERDRYERLAIFPEDVDVPLATLERLWDCDDLEVEDLCQQMADLSLLLRYDLGTRTIRLHGVFRTYLRQTHSADLPAWNNHFLDAYRCRDWTTLPPEEPYLWQGLTYHLREAGRANELRALLLDFDWLQAKLDATDGNALLSDFAGLTDDEPLQLLESAISMSAHAIADDKHQLAGQLVGRLIGHSANHPKLASFVEQARACENYPALLPQLPTLTQAGGSLIRTVPLEGTCNAIAFTEDGEYAVVASFSHVNVFELATGALPTSFSQTQHTHMVTKLAVQGAIVVSGDNENTVKVWRWRDGTLLTVFAQHTDEISAVAIQGEIVVTGDNGGTVKVWRWENGELVTDFTLHTERVNAVAVQDDIVVSGAWDHTVKVWRWEDGTLVTDFSQHTDRVYTVALQGDIVVSGAADGTVKVWRWRDGTLLTNFMQHTGAGAVFALAVQGEIVVSGDGGSKVKVWRWEDGTLLTEFALHTGVISAVAVQGDIVISGSCPDNIVKVWRWRVGTPQTGFRPHQDVVRSVAVQGEIVVSSSYDHTMKVWRWENGALLKEFKFHTWPVGQVVVLGDIIVFVWGRTVRVFRWPDEVLFADFRLHTAEVLAVTVQGEVVVSGSADHTVKVWRWRDGTLLTDFAQHKDKVYAVTVQGDVVISRSADGAVKVWRWQDGTLLADLAQDIIRNTTVKGKIIVSVSDYGTIKVWHWGTGEVLAAFTADAIIGDLAIDPNKHVIVAGDFKGHVHVLRPNAALLQLMGEGGA